MLKETRFSRPWAILPTNVFNPSLHQNHFSSIDFKHITNMITSEDITKNDLIAA